MVQPAEFFWKIRLRGSVDYLGHSKMSVDDDDDYDEDCFGFCLSFLLVIIAYMLKWLDVMIFLFVGVSLVDSYSLHINKLRERKSVCM